jgi:hypothetical protein
VTHSSKRKGDVAELEVAAILTDHLGFPVRRKLGAGRADDTGDLHGIPDTIVQVANWADALRAVRTKPIEAEQQRLNDGALFAATAVRLRGGVWRFVLTDTQYATYVRESVQ